jgi:hypothetical protein
MGSLISRLDSRRVCGAAVLGISLAVALVLYFSGSPLVTFKRLPTSYFPGGSATATSMRLDWRSVAVCIPGFLGLIALVWPARKPPRL